jgi:hypothetical protein
MFRFTIRDVLWLTVVVALGVALWLAWRQSQAQISDLRRSILHERANHEAEVERAKKTHQAELAFERYRHQRELELERAAPRREKGIPLGDPAARREP